MSHNVKEGNGFFRDQCDWCVLIRFLLGGSERRLRVGTADCAGLRAIRGENRFGRDKNGVYLA